MALYGVNWGRADENGFRGTRTGSLVFIPMESLKSFIVHGHDQAARFELKNLLQNSFHWEERVIFTEMPSMGLTIIEKFERAGSMPKTRSVY